MSAPTPHLTHRPRRTRRTRRTRRPLAAASALLTSAALTATVSTPPATAAPPSERHAGGTQLVVPWLPRHWDPLTDAKWSLGLGRAVMTERGDAPTGPRRPFEYAVVTTGPELASVDYRAQVRIDEPVARDDRDVILVFNYQSPTRFSYAHLSQDNTIYPHNGIFVVDDADRVRVDDQWDGAVGAPPAIDDTDWHDVRLTFDAATARVAVYVDDLREPLMTGTDPTFDGGRIGFGSFDNYGRVRGAYALGTTRP